MKVAVAGMTIELNGMSEQEREEAVREVFQSAEREQVGEAEVIPLTDYQLRRAIVFAGKQAGVCKAQESYFESAITGEEAASNRFKGATKSGHHSVAEHVSITIELEGISKVLAMILNSLQDYVTSEKSGRFTVMGCSDPMQKALYDKWYHLIFNFIKERDLVPVNPALPKEKQEKQQLDRISEKAKENARYMLSVFNPATSMAYTGSLLHWNYIIDWCADFQQHRWQSKFAAKIAEELATLQHALERILKVDSLRDKRAREFDFLAEQIGHPVSEITKEDEVIRDVYQVSYKASMVALAQLQRNRTAKLWMVFNGEATEFYVPEFFVGTRLEQEWLEDLASVADEIPQATLVKVVENGQIGNFLTFRCTDRLCFRAMNEAKNVVAGLMLRFKEEGKFSRGWQKEFDGWFDRKGQPTCRCCSQSKLNECREKCGFADEAISRLC